MKKEIVTVLNKLVTYAQDNLMLDALDATYALNRLASLTGATPAAADADYGDKTLSELLDELGALCPSIDTTAVTDVLLPLPHTVNYYFADEFGRSPQKAFDFVYDLYADCGVSKAPSGGADGYSYYVAGTNARNVELDGLKYTPIAAANRIAALECPDLMSEDITSRMAKFAEEYRMTIAKRVGNDGAYYCCQAAALSQAKPKSSLSDGIVKISSLDYPVPALSLVGPKNSVAARAARLVKAANEAKLPCVLACAHGEKTAFYLVFANDVPQDGIFGAPTPLAACGVFATADLTQLLSVLEKGTALSTDLFAFKPIYTAIGGVKLGDKAQKELDAEAVKQFKTALALAASADAEKIENLVKETEV